MKQFIKCKKCKNVVLQDDELMQCPHCGYIMLGAEWNPLKALSIKQPWAWLIVNGHKDIENRNGLKNFRGTFLIHTGMRGHNIDITPTMTRPEKKALTILLRSKDTEINYGGIIGHAEIYDCVTKSDSPWFVGKNGLMLRNPKPLPFTPCKGKLSFFYPEID